jgi:RNA recognition motif-containing protein
MQGFCFVEFDSPDTANRALAVMDGIEVAGRAIRVRVADIVRHVSALC